VVPADQFVPAAAPAAVSADGEEAVDATPAEYQTPPDEVPQPGLQEYRLDRDGADWGTNLVGYGRSSRGMRQQQRVQQQAAVAAGGCS
jgi:hypothetical protein